MLCYAVDKLYEDFSKTSNSLSSWLINVYLHLCSVNRSCLDHLQGLLLHRHHKKLISETIKKINKTLPQPQKQQHSTICSERQRMICWAAITRPMKHHRYRHVRVELHTTLHRCLSRSSQRNSYQLRGSNWDQLPAGSELKSLYCFATMEILHCPHLPRRKMIRCFLERCCSLKHQLQQR